MFEKKEPKTIPPKALGFLFSGGIETQVEKTGRKKKFIQDINYYKALGEFAVISERRTKSLSPMVENAVAEFASSEPLLTDNDPGEVTFKFLPVRITNAKTDARELEITDDKNRSVGFAFSKDLQVVIRPNLLDSSAPVNFGLAFMGMSCSEEYLQDMAAITKPLYANAGKTWKSVYPSSDDKFSQVYIPMLQRFGDELHRLCDIPGNAERFVQAFFGDKDYYQVVLSEKAKTIRINGLLPYRRDKMSFPTKLLTAGLKESQDGGYSDTTLCCEFDKGWVLNLRLHPTNTKIQPTSLRFEADFKGSRPEGTTIMVYAW